MMRWGDDMMIDVRTTVNIDEHLLAEAKVRAAREHRALGAVLDDALRLLFATSDQQPADLDLPRFVPDVPGLRPGVDLFDRDQVAELVGDDDLAVP